MNSIILIGNLTKDIEKKDKKASSTLAVNEYSQAGQETMYIDLLFFEKNAENAAKFLKKGSKIAIKGALKLQTWQAQDGSKKSRHVIFVQTMEFLDSKKVE